jgi:hypothetical protein
MARFGVGSSCRAVSFGGSDLRRTTCLIVFIFPPESRKLAFLQGGIGLGIRGRNCPIAALARAISLPKLLEL